MATTKNQLHQAQVMNNCPECYNAEGLEFTFFQTIHENLFFSKPEHRLEETLHCHTCENTIYPVSWTDDIERVHTYHEKIALENKQHFSLKPAAYVFIALDVLLLCGILFYFLK